jgi:hypothetical protein
MGTLIFVCPATGEEVSTGLDTELPTTLGVGKSLLSALPTAAPNGWN